VNRLSADLAGLPPIAVYDGTDELFAGEAIEFADRAKAAGNEITLYHVPAGQPSFIIGAGRVPEVDHAVTEMGRWLRVRSLDSSPPRHSQQNRRLWPLAHSSGCIT
jgi:epsilon-lactone hydrolase